MICPTFSKTYKEYQKQEKTHSEEAKQLEPESDVTQMLELPDREIKTIMIKMFRAVVEKITTCKNRWVI